MDVTSGIPKCYRSELGYLDIPVPFLNIFLMIPTKTGILLDVFSHSRTILHFHAKITKVDVTSGLPGIPECYRFEFRTLNIPVLFLNIFLKSPTKSGMF